jgi:hypothetical protein
MDNIGTIGRFYWFFFWFFFLPIGMQTSNNQTNERRTRRIHVNRKTHKEKPKIQIRKRKRKRKRKMDVGFCCCCHSRRKRLSNIPIYGHVSLDVFPLRWPFLRASHSAQASATSFTFSLITITQSHVNLFYSLSAAGSWKIFSHFFMKI